MSEPLRPIVGMSIAEVEKHLILKTIERCRGNKIKAAKILGISIRTVRNKLKQYNQKDIK
jgi:DNA-binding protein Fis